MYCWMGLFAGAWTVVLTFNFCIWLFLRDTLCILYNHVIFSLYFGLSDGWTVWNGLTKKLFLFQDVERIRWKGRKSGAWNLSRYGGQKSLDSKKKVPFSALRRFMWSAVGLWEGQPTVAHPASLSAVIFLYSLKSVFPLFTSLLSSLLSSSCSD